MKLGLGTVQFGMNYGFSNSRGRMPEPEVAETLDLAARSGIQVLDTAQAYGDSETILGKLLPTKHDFRIVTKIGAAANRATSQAVQAFRTGFRRSLEKLGQDSIYALLCHDAAQLLGPGGPAIWDEMMALRDEGRVEKIGVSIYTQKEITQLLAAFKIDIIQVPYNLLDQRLFLGGALRALKREGIEIHTRSTFLQGLLLVEPRNLNERFAPLREHLEKTIVILRDHGLAPLPGALACSIQRAEIDTVLVGVASPEELREILTALAAVPASEIDFSLCALTDEKFLNPSNWNLLPREHRTRS